MIIENITPGDLLPGDNIKRFSGKKTAKGYDPGVCPWKVGSSKLGISATIRIDPDKRTILVELPKMGKYRRVRDSSGLRVSMCESSRHDDHYILLIGRIDPDKGYIDNNGVIYDPVDGSHVGYLEDIAAWIGISPKRLHRTVVKWCDRYLREHSLPRVETTDAYCRNGEFVRRQQCKRKAKRRRKKMQRIAIR